MIGGVESQYSSLIGGSGQGGEPAAQVGEHSPGAVHREPHAGQPSLSGSQPEVTKVRIYERISFEQNMLTFSL